jgi:hypothetical protein
VRREVRHPHQRTDPQTGCVDLDRAESGEAIDVEHPRRTDNSFLQPVDQLRPAGQQHRAGVVAQGADRNGRNAHSLVAEDLHWPPLFAPETSRIAATICGYALQRQMLPLMNSRISPSDPA